MSASTRVLDTIQSCSNIVLAQIPAACNRVASETRYALSSLRSGSELGSIHMEAQSIYVGVYTFYVQVMASAKGHSDSLAGNEYAAQSARQWRQQAGFLLEALVDGFAGLEGAENEYIKSCKLLNEHLMTNATMYKTKYRVERTDHLTAVIQKKEPDYRKPAHNRHLFGLVIAAAIIALLFMMIPKMGYIMNMPRGMSIINLLGYSFIEVVALLLCAIMMKAKKEIPAKILSVVPILCHVMTLVRILGRVPMAALFSRMWYTPFFEPSMGYGFYAICNAVTGLSMLALMVYLPLYIWGFISVDSKNEHVATIFCIMILGMIFTAIFPLMDGVNGYYLPNVISALAIATAATSIVWSFENFLRKKPAAKNEAKKGIE